MPVPLALVDCNNFYASCERVFQPEGGAAASRHGRQRQAHRHRVARFSGDLARRVQLQEGRGHVLDLVPAASVQGGLFDAPDSPARERLMGIIDRVNARHGRDTIGLARSGRQWAWKLRSEHLSPRYTTSWEEVLRVGSSDRVLDERPSRIA